jgi:excisionase family DNA binding protein
MQATTNADSERITGLRNETAEAVLLSVDELATMLNCSTRTARRLADAGAMPRPVKLGSLVRWRTQTGDPMTGILDWVEAGCPSCRRAGR